MYVIYDFASAWENFEQEEMTPWAFYAIGAVAVCLAHGAYTVVMIIMTVMDMFFSEYAATADTLFISVNNGEFGGAFFWGFIALNSAAIAVPLSKLIWIMVEDG